MSIEREIRRSRMAEAMKENGMRTRCRKCGTRMTSKEGWGWVCEKCGWESVKHMTARLELEQMARDYRKGREKEVDGD